jgi:hypothetical protein
MTTAYPADFVAQHEIITKSWRTDKCPDAKQLRDKTAGELRKEGWTIECFAADMGQFSVYGFEGYRKRTSQILGNQ